MDGLPPIIDLRQSATALRVQRGVMRLLRETYDMACFAEVSLPHGRRADVMGVGAKGEIWIVEIKTSIEDFRVDRKWPDYRLHCDRLFFATHQEVPLDIFPEECGLFVSDGYGAHLLREAPEHKLSPASRKAMMLNFSRAAAHRLMMAEWATGRSFDEL